MATREREDAVEVVRLFVGDEDRPEVGGGEPEARQATLGVARPEPAVDEDAGRAGFHHQRVPAAAAPQ